MQAKIDNHDELEEVWHQVPADYYQKGVATNRLQRLWHIGKLSAVISLTNNLNPKSILDVGSASGWFLSEIKKRFKDASCTGVDVYEPAIELARKLYPKITFQVCDAHTLPFPAKSFDLVVCTEVLEHVVDPEKVVSEIKRVLKPSGRAIVEMDSGNVLFRLAWYWWTNLRRGVWKDAHIHVFNASLLERLLAESGMRIVAKKTFNFSMGVVFVLEKTKESL